MSQLPPPGGDGIKGDGPIAGGAGGPDTYKIKLSLLQHPLDVGIAVCQHRPGGGGVGARLVLGLIFPHRVGEDTHLHPRGIFLHRAQNCLQGGAGKGTHIALVADAAPLAEVSPIGGGGLFIIILVQEKAVRTVVPDKLPHLLPDEVQGGGIHTGGPAHRFPIPHVHGVVDAVDIQPLGPRLGDGVGQRVKEGGEGREIFAVVDDPLLPRRLEDYGVELHGDSMSDGGVYLRLHLLLRAIPGKKILPRNQIESPHLIRLIVGVDHRLLPIGISRGVDKAGVIRVLRRRRGGILPRPLRLLGGRRALAGRTGSKKRGILHIPQEKRHGPGDGDDACKEAPHQRHQLAIVVQQIPHNASSRCPCSFR